MKEEKKRMRINLLNKLKTLFVLFPKNHPLRAGYGGYTQWDIPDRVKQSIVNQVEKTILTAYQRGKKKGYERGLVDGAIMGEKK